MHGREHPATAGGPEAAEPGCMQEESLLNSAPRSFAEAIPTRHVG